MNRRDTPTSSTPGRSNSDAHRNSAPPGLPQVTLFTIPKPFGVDDHTDLIQRNAIASWHSLGPRVDVVLLGDEPGIAEAAVAWQVRHLPGLKYNDHGTPRVDSAFQLARQHSKAPLLAYCNSDVILLPDMINTVESMQSSPWTEWVAFGRRTDLKLEREIDFAQAGVDERLLLEARQRGTVCSQVCKEYFIFPQELFAEMPSFAIGRGNWDNWMIHHARSRRIPVVNVSPVMTAIHQTHDYGHADGDRLQCYVSGPEARENQRLGGGRHLIRGSVGDYRLTRSGLRREQPLLINPAFWADVPRFARLITHLLLGR